jgi:hypothetical protein
MDRTHVSIITIPTSISQTDAPTSLAIIDTKALSDIPGLWSIKHNSFGVGSMLYQD